MINAPNLACIILALAAPAASAAGSLRGSRRTQSEGMVTTEGPTDIDIAIAKFALNLECLEAEFYSYAAYGYGLTDDLRGYGPEPIGGMKATLSPEVQAYAEEIAKNEIAHVGVLRAALGDLAPACPQIDIGPAFAAVANAAAATVFDPPYTPYDRDTSFLLGAFLFEDVGVTAYNGAAPLLTNKGILSTAASILAVEAYHGGSLRTLLYQQEDVVLTPHTFTVGEAVALASALRAFVGGGKDKALETDGVLSIIPVDENSLAFARTATEVLNIVYLGSASTPGGFFPNGINMT
ncbi:ferritin-like domain-containing protein [Tribonema minus]|uniref:Ferritin-like domain-containing protein n=1 Tax=Tribonema minus TaxID=303371 RepID=A0A835YNE3_9STRA|nr:ferritin-like domain-containing protein [Tribonema minus]